MVDPRLRLKMGVDVITDYPGFLQGVADWIKERRSGQGQRTGVAITEVRKAPLVWVGVGVYTASEIWFYAGEFALHRAHG
jgi:hypothetical protein